MTTERFTMAQAVIKFLMNQYVERDGEENQFFAGCFGSQSGTAAKAARNARATFELDDLYGRQDGC